jgi:hypothetical protein
MSNPLTIPDDLLHHYTNQTGLLGIIQTKSIWASKIQYLNDTSEFFHGLSIASQLLTSHEKSASDDSFARHCAALRSHLKRIEGINVFVVSLSASEDLLSQWRAYSRVKLAIRSVSRRTACKNSREGRDLSWRRVFMTPSCSENVFIKSLTRI